MTPFFIPAYLLLKAGRHSFLIYATQSHVSINIYIATD